MRVKIFANFSIQRLEVEVNEWLEVNAGKTARISEIKHAVSDRCLTLVITYMPIV